MPETRGQQQETQKLIITVKPNGFESLILGEYPNKDAALKFEYHYDPMRKDAIAHAEAFQDIKNGVRHIVHFSNFDDRPVTVTVRPAAED